MSIGYRKEGYATAVEVKKGGVTVDNIAFGILPVSINLPVGFDRYIIEQDSPLLSTMTFDTSSLASGETMDVSIKIQKQGTYVTVGTGTVSRSDNTVYLNFKAVNISYLYGPSVSIKFAIVNYAGANYFVFFYLGIAQNNKPCYYLKESYVTAFDRINLAEEVINGFPYGDGESTSQGGQGEMDDTTEPIEIDGKPLLTTGEFLRIYKMTATNLTALRDKLISQGFLDNLIAKLRTDAMDYIIGLNAIPFSSTSVAESSIKIANLDTEISASYLTWYIEDFDFGEIELKEYFQTFMDYSPYTKLSVFVPFCGIVPLNVDQFMNDKIKMKCRIDLLTGQFVVFISNSVGIVTTVSGNCAYQLPIRANDYNRLVTSGLGLLGGIVGTAGALATGNVPLAIGAGLGTVGGLMATSQAMTKPDVTSKGALGGNYGLLGNRTPYLIIQRPTISVPSDYGKTIGYMSRITAKLGDLTGYTVVEEIHLEHIFATDDEKKMIENALKSGVIL